MITFIKLGGSLITDKKQEQTFRPEVARRIADEIASARRAAGTPKLLVGHGSGSFGHVAASRYRTIQGVHTTEEWRGFAEVATVAAELNHLMARTLHDAGVPAWRLQPSSSALARDGKIVHMAVEPVRTALDRDLVPLVYGDVALDEVRGGTIISTETIFFFLAHHVPVGQILLLGEVDGVYDVQGDVIEEITPANLADIESALGGSAGVDVTGGMETKVRDMLALVQALPHLTIRIMNGTRPGLLESTLRGSAAPGTVIRALASAG